MSAGFYPRHRWRRSALICVAALVLAATSVLIGTRPVGAAKAVCGGIGSLPAPIPGGGIAFPDAMHGWVVGTRTSLDLCIQRGGGVVATSDGGVTWKPQRVPIGVTTLSGVSFLNDLDGWAVGGNSIIKTVDGGASWALQAAAPAGMLLVNVDFVNASDGWAVGINCSNVGCLGVVVATTNGGASWAIQTIPGGVAGLYSVAFADAVHGWAVGSADCGTGLDCPGVVLATTNGGATWSTQTVPSGVLTLQGVTFVTSSQGWAVGYAGVSGCVFVMPFCTAAIIATTDGGSTWHTQAIPPGLDPLSGVTFLNSSVAWAVGGTSLLTTVDGGTTWIQQSLPGGTIGRGVAVMSASVGLVSFTPTSFQLAGAAFINKTIDAGVTWQAEQIPTVPAGLFDVAFAGASAGIASGEACNAVGAGFGGACSASITATGGRRSWVGEPTPPSASGTYLDSVAFPTSNAAWAVGTNCGLSGCTPLILMSANGGASWTSQTVPAGVTDINDVSFAGGSDGWAVGGDCTMTGCTQVILATIDAGTTWNLQPVPGGGFDLTAVAALNSTTAWAVGPDNSNGSVILGTTNGGTTWTTETFPNAGLTTLEDVSFVNASDGWAVGQSCPLTGCAGVIFATTNGGTTWSTQAFPPALVGKFAILYGVDFVNALDGWAVGQSCVMTACGAAIVATTNGGSSWAVQTLPNQLGSAYGVLLGVSFVDSTNGWAVGATNDISVILHTTDGGINWIQQPIEDDVSQSPPMSPRPRDAANQSGALSPKPRIPLATPARRRTGAR
jgi:photosystem II stability/assembly factor-like uncharacterized protein